MIRFVLLVGVCFLLLGCRKNTLQPEIITIQSPVNTPIRFIHELNGAFVLGGGESAGNGFVIQLDKSLQVFTTLKDTFSAPVYDAAYFHGRYVLIKTGAEIVYSYDLQTYFPHYLKVENFVPDLHQQPGRRIAINTDSSSMFIVSGGEFEYGLMQKGAEEDFQSWKPTIYGNELRSIAFDANGTGWAGGFGILLRSNDHGGSWNRLSFPQQFITDFSFMSRANGVLSTFDGHFYYTVNGSDWKSSVKEGKRVFINRVKHLTVNKILAVGNEGTFCLSEDGGKKWKCDTYFGGKDLYDFHVLSTNEVIVVGESGKLWKTNI
jgi:hypothetical protein